MTTRVLIADGEPVLREGLAELLACQPDFLVIGEAATASDAVAEARARRPDIVLLSLNLPIEGGIAAAEQIRLACPSTRVIVMVPPRSETTPVDPGDGPAHGVISYGARADHVLTRIRTLGQPASGNPANATRAHDGRSARLTPREEQVCALLARAYSNREIEAELGIHNSAVKRHVHRILMKLGAHNRVEVAIQLALAGGELQERGPR